MRRSKPLGGRRRPALGTPGGGRIPRHWQLRSSSSSSPSLPIAAVNSTRATFPRTQEPAAPPATRPGSATPTGCYTAGISSASPGASRAGASPSPLPRKCALTPSPLPPGQPHRRLLGTPAPPREGAAGPGTTIPRIHRACRRPGNSLSPLPHHFLPHPHHSFSFHLHCLFCVHLGFGSGT